MTRVNDEHREEIPEPTFADYELAIRAVSAAKLRPGEEARLDTPALIEARYRVENCVRSEIAAARASFLALAPDAADAMKDLLGHYSPKIRLGALALWAKTALPADPVQISHTHSLDPADRQLASQAAADFSRLTNELSKRITGYQTSDISASPHLLRGEAARPLSARLEVAQAAEAEK